MYLPSLFFGGSSLIHLLASPPRVVAVFGLAGLMTTLLQSPLGRPDVHGTAGYLQHLEQTVGAPRAVSAPDLARAQATAQALTQASPAQLTEIITTTLRQCGAGCTALEVSGVLASPAVLRDVLTVHALNTLHRERVAATRATAGRDTDGPQ